jgi:hypothetical protein
LLKLSVVVIKNGNLESLARSLSSLLPQIEGKPYEIVVPVDSCFENPDEARRRFPAVRFVDLGIVPSRATPGTFLHHHDLFETRVAGGLLAAKGEVVGLLQDLFVPDPDWCDKTVAAHAKLPYEVIGGAVEHAGKGLLSWSIYLLEFSRYQLPLKEGSVGYIADVNVAYKRKAIEWIRPLMNPRYNEAVAHWHIMDKGGTLWQVPEMIVRQDRGPLGFFHLAGERLSWGAVFGGARAYAMSWPKRLLYVLGSPLIPFVRIFRIGVKVFGDRRNQIPFLLSLPAQFAMVSFWTAGETFGTLTGFPKPSKPEGT